MLNLQQIENIIKTKYNDIVITSTDCFTRFMFDIKDVASHQEIMFYFDSEDKLYYEKEIWNTEARYQDCNFAIENNAIELKHYLNIKITKQDMIDWIKTFKSYKILRNHEYNISEDYLIIEDKEELSLFSKVILDDDFCIFTATNSQEYWRLYNIIKNLKG